MTPDIREKAERLARKFLLGHNQEYLLGTDWHNDLTSAISQALLEAHNAGRAEMREEAAKRVDIIAAMRRQADREATDPDYPAAIMETVAKLVDSIATAIRSIK